MVSDLDVFLPNVGFDGPLLGPWRLSDPQHLSNDRLLHNAFLHDGNLYHVSLVNHPRGDAFSRMQGHIVVTPVQDSTELAAGFLQALAPRLRNPLAAFRVDRLGR